MSFPLSKEKVFGLSLYQPARGYRYSLDAFLLASFVRLKRGQRALELGAGCGVVTLILAARNPENRFWGLEIQRELVLCFRRNVWENGLAARVLPVLGDVRRLPLKDGAFEVVYANPPYYREGAGRLSPDPQERLARHEILATLKDFVEAAYRALKARGRFFLVCTAKRLSEALSLLEGRRLSPKRLTLVHSYPGDEARLFLLEAAKEGGAELRVEPPLFVYEKKGGPYSPEVKEILGLSQTSSGQG